MKDAFDLKKSVQEVAPLSFVAFDSQLFECCFIQKFGLEMYKLLMVMKLCRQDIWPKLLERVWEVLCKDL